MKQLTNGKITEKIEKALDKYLPLWYDYAYTSQKIGDCLFIDLTACVTDKLETVQVFMDINLYDARKAVIVEFA